MLSAEPKPKADNTYQDLELNLIMLSYIVLKKKRTNTALCTWNTVDIALGNHALRAHGLLIRQQGCH